MSVERIHPRGPGDGRRKMRNAGSCKPLGSQMALNLAEAEQAEQQREWALMRIKLSAYPEEFAIFAAIEGATNLDS